MINFCNINFRGLSRSMLFVEDTNLKIIIPTNAEIIVKAQHNSKFKNIIDNNFATFDGQIPFFIASKQNSNVLIEKISGSDLIYDFCEMAKKRIKKYFY